MAANRTEPTDAEIAECVRWMLRENLCFDVCGGVVASKSPVFDNPGDFVDAVQRFRAAVGNGTLLNKEVDHARD